LRVDACTLFSGFLGMGKDFPAGKMSLRSGPAVFHIGVQFCPEKFPAAWLFYPGLANKNTLFSVVCVWPAACKQ
jgi:hypothetical protein